MLPSADAMRRRSLQRVRKREHESATSKYETAFAEVYAGICGSCARQSTIYIYPFPPYSLHCRCEATALQCVFIFQELREPESGGENVSASSDTKLCSKPMRVEVAMRSHVCEAFCEDNWGPASRVRSSGAPCGAPDETIPICSAGYGAGCRFKAALKAFLLRSVPSQADPSRRSCLPGSVLSPSESPKARNRCKRHRR
jgi:hypothetical protein